MQAAKSEVLLRRVYWQKQWSRTELALIEQ